MRICGTSIILYIRRCIGHVASVGLFTFLIMPMSVGTSFDLVSGRQDVGWGQC